jgi:uncharacterized membrane protein
LYPTAAQWTTNLPAMVSTGPPMAPYEQRENGAGDDWAAQIADSIEGLVGNVRDKTTGPLLTIAKAVVYGTFGAVVAVAVLILAIIALVRFIDAYLPSAVFGDQHTWAAYLLLGLIFSIVGVFLWSRRRAREQTVAEWR